MSLSDPLVGIIDAVLDNCDPNCAHDLLYSFSYAALTDLYPETLEKCSDISADNLAALRLMHKGKSPAEVFDIIDKTTSSQEFLLMNLYQAIQETSDLDSVDELIFGLWETLEREGYPKLVIHDVFKNALVQFHL
ncbi:hypothetical protein [Cochlodiniinecator piscidefendens]|uniref:hypothetical protein n=1 Tax=Cochlodiniinecator piscidefendens TaxID=2715756 RepID=UPI00197C91F4|nr:hypothetical protein [Cochlodiniinecator piscidefendens]